MAHRRAAHGVRRLPITQRGPALGHVRSDVGPLLIETSHNRDKPAITLSVLSGCGGLIFSRRAATSSRALAMTLRPRLNVGVKLSAACRRSSFLVWRLYRGSHLSRTSNIALIAAFPTAMRRRIKTASSGHMCGKPATPPDDFGAAEKKIAVPAEPLKKLDVDRPGIRAGDMIAIPLPNIGSMGGECWPLSEGAIAEKAVPSNLLQMGVSS